jgi:cytochrome c5
VSRGRLDLARRRIDRAIPLRNQQAAADFHRELGVELGDVCGVCGEDLYEYADGSGNPVKGEHAEWCPRRGGADGRL